MYCRECGKQIPDGSAFCPYCGKKLSYDRSDAKEEKEFNNPYESSFDEQSFSKVDEEHQFDDDPFKEFDKPKEEQIDTAPERDPNRTFAKLTFFFGLFGLILGSIPLCIISLVFSKKGMRCKALSDKASNGRLLAIIGLVLWGTLIVIYYVYCLYVGIGNLFW